MSTSGRLAYGHNPAFKRPLVGVHDGRAIGFKCWVGQGDRWIESELNRDGQVKLSLLEGPEWSKERAHFLEAALVPQVYGFLAGLACSLPANVDSGGDVG